jgi:DNA end-binding protein Ku
MPARATSSGTISFGLVSIPVKLYTATSAKNVHFHMLHEKDKSRLKQQYVCAACGEVVERSATVRGYEYTRDQYVVMTQDELAALEKKTDQTIEIEEFVPIESVDPLYFEKSSLLGPDKGGAKAYRLLNEALLVSGRVAIGRHSARGRQSLVLIRPLQRGLVLHGLFYADEVRRFDDIEFGDDVSLKPGELELAGQLIEQLAAPRFDPGKYEDEYRRDVLAAIDRKVAGEEIVALPRAEAREQIIDLVAALKQSLAAKKVAPREAAQAAAASGGGGGKVTSISRKPSKGKGESPRKRGSS